MGNMYRRTSKTYIYLGDMDESARYLTNLASSFSETFRGSPQLPLEDTPYQPWQTRLEAFNQDEPNLIANVRRHWTLFISRPWFTRVWVIQEKLLSKKPLLLIGGEAFPWGWLQMCSQLLLHAALLLNRQSQTAPSMTTELVSSFEAHSKLKSYHLTHPLIHGPRSRPAPPKHLTTDLANRYRVETMCLYLLHAGIGPDDVSKDAAVLTLTPAPDDDERLSDDFLRLYRARPLVAQHATVSWPQQWWDYNKTSTTRLSDAVPNKPPPPISNPGMTLSGPQLYSLLEQLVELHCSDSRDRLFALLGLFEGSIPPALSIDYAKPASQVYVDLSWFLLKNGVFEVLSSASLCRKSTRDDDLPSWAVDWSKCSRSKRAAFDNLLQMPENISQFRGGRSVTFRRVEQAIVLRGRLSEDPVQTTIGPEPFSTDDTSSLMRFKTTSRIDGVTVSVVQKHDMLCLFEGCGKCYLIRQRGRYWSLVGQAGLSPAMDDRGLQDINWTRLIADAR